MDVKMETCIATCIRASHPWLSLSLSLSLSHTHTHTHTHPGAEGVESAAKWHQRNGDGHCCQLHRHGRHRVGSSLLNTDSNTRRQKLSTPSTAEGSRSNPNSFPPLIPPQQHPFCPSPPPLHPVSLSLFLSLCLNAQPLTQAARPRCPCPCVLALLAPPRDTPALLV